MKYPEIKPENLKVGDVIATFPDLENIVNTEYNFIIISDIQEISGKKRVSYFCVINTVKDILQSNIGKLIKESKFNCVRTNYGDGCGKWCKLFLIRRKNHYNHKNTMEYSLALDFIN